MALINPELWVNDSRSETGCIGEDLPIIRRTPQGERRRCQHGEGRLFRNTPFSGLCDGVADEAAERRTWCVADYMTAVRHPSKTLAAALFMFFATLFSTVALGSLAERRTANRMGLTEYLFMNAVAGVVHALAGAQPLLVLRPTGPITAITVKLADAADAFGFDFHQFAAATGLWVGLLMALVAATATSKHIRRLTPFTHDIFACFVCSIYLHDGVSDVVARLDASSPSIFGRTLFGFNLAVLTFLGSLLLSLASGWAVLPTGIKSLVADYAVTISVVAVTAVSFFSSQVADGVERISLPDDFGPTCRRIPAGGAHIPAGGGCVDLHEAGEAVRRAWFVGLPSQPLCWFIALNASIPITFFFFMDQNISSLLCQLPEMKLSRGSYLHSSFLLMAIFNAIGPMFGLPFVTGSLPHSPQFVRSLTFADATPMGSASLGSSPPKVAESRVAPLIMYALIGLPLLAPRPLELIPEAAIDGILAYVGYEGIVSTDLWARVVLLVTPRSNFPPRYAPLPAHRIHLFTAVQLAMFTLCWAVNLSPLGLCVAFVVVSLVPLRERVLPSVFTPDELALLDAGRIVAPSPSDSPPTATRDALPPASPRGGGVLLPFAVSRHAVEDMRAGGSAGEAKNSGVPPLATMAEAGEAPPAEARPQYRQGALGGRAEGGGQGYLTESAGSPVGGGEVTQQRLSGSRV